MNYRVGFALTTALGNETRYLNMKKYADRVDDFDCVWAPISHYLDPDPYERWPGPLRAQKVLNHQAAAIFDRWSDLEAVVTHAFQLHAYLVLYRVFRRPKPLLVLYQDYAPFRDVSILRAYGQNVQWNWKRRSRFVLERTFTRRADLFFPWSEWAKDALIRDCRVEAERIHVVNVGVDLELWPYQAPRSGPGRLRLLFVGGDFTRKGGDVLVDVFRNDLSAIAELDIVTRHVPVDLPDHVRVHQNLSPNDGRLRDLYAQCDVFVLPTRADMSSLAAIEAMATGRPVIASPVGGIPDIVSDGVTGFLVPSEDKSRLRDRLLALAGDEQLRHRMGRAGRERVERQLNAETEVARMLATLRSVIDQRRHRAPGAVPS